VLNGGVSHYLQVWKGSGGNSAGFDEFFVNSAIIAFLTIFGQTLFSIMAAYAFARMKFPGSNILFALFLTTLFIPFMVILIPNYLTVVDINDWFVDNVGPAFDDLGQYPPFEWIGLDATDAAWIDNWPALVIPFLASTFSIFLLRQFFIQIPNDLWDAARIDGAGHILFLFRVVVPISRAAIVTVVLFTFIGTWDQLEWPILVTRTDEWRPISYALYDFQSTEGARPNLLMAGAVIALFPVVLVYLIAQKQFTEGIATTGLKG
jgi:ABC-type glycerol-3-phosphate transport system permease component